MEIKLSKEGLTKTGVILLLLSGLVFHDFFALKYVKLGIITITYLRVILVITIPLLIFLYKVIIRKNDAIAYFLLVFMAYGLTRIEGNFKEAFALYCPIIAFSFLYFSINNSKELEKCIDFLAYALIFFCFVGVFEVITGYHFVETHLDQLDEIYHVACGMYYNENDFSAFLSIMIFYILLSKLKRNTKLLYILISFAIICINKSVICILGLISFLLLSFIFRNRINRVVKVVLVLILILICFKPIYDFIQTSSIWWRSYMYSYGIKNVFANFLIGTGIGRYRDGMTAVGYKPYKKGGSADPHNLFFELAGVFGITWAILLIILLVKLLIWNLKRVSNRENRYLLGLIYIIPFVGLASSSCLEKNFIYLALLIPIVKYRFNKDSLSFADNSSIKNVKFLMSERFN